MTTIRQLIQTSPARANELFAKLVDTSESAVKTREKLYSELRDELKRLASLEEQHLFPVLRKHKHLKDLVRDALNDNKTTGKLLTELDHLPKDSEEFTAQVAELRQVFQQHVRDEKKELLPAILKALSDEEAEAVVESIEAGKAAIEEAQRAEAEERREFARQQREQAQRLQQDAEVVANTVWAAPRTVEQASKAAQEAVQTGISTTTDIAQRATDQLTGVLSEARRRARDLTERTSQNLETVSRSSTLFARGVQEVSGECLDMVQERVQKNLDGVNALVRCRSLAELLRAQSALVRDNMELTLTNTRRLAEISSRLANNATRAVTAQPE